MKKDKTANLLRDLAKKSKTSVNNRNVKTATTALGVTGSSMASGLVSKKVDVNFSKSEIIESVKLDSNIEGHNTKAQDTDSVNNPDIDTATISNGSAQEIKAFVNTAYEKLLEAGLDPSTIKSVVSKLATPDGEIFKSVTTHMQTTHNMMVARATIFLNGTLWKGVSHSSTAFFVGSLCYPVIVQAFNIELVPFDTLGLDAGLDPDFDSIYSIRGTIESSNVPGEYGLIETKFDAEFIKPQMWEFGGEKAIKLNHSKFIEGLGERYKYCSAEQLNAMQLIEKELDKIFADDPNEPFFTVSNIISKVNIKAGIAFLFVLAFLLPGNSMATDIPYGSELFF